MKQEHVWIFDSNRRVYPKAPEGKLWASGGPIYREHWVRHDVVGETTRSFVTRHGVKVPKAGGPGFALSLAQVENDVWVHDHRYRILREVEKLRCAETLRKVATVLGYNPETQDT